VDADWVTLATNGTAIKFEACPAGQTVSKWLETLPQVCRGGSMLDVKSLLLALLSSSWGVITVVLIGAIVYRGVLSTREDDQLFLDDAEQHYYQDQQTIIARISRLKGPIIALSLASALFFLMTVGVWVYQGYSSF